MEVLDLTWWLIVRHTDDLVNGAMRTFYSTVGILNLKEMLLHQISLPSASFFVRSLLIMFFLTPMFLKLSFVLLNSAFHSSIILWLPNVQNTSLALLLLPQNVCFLLIISLILSFIIFSFLPSTKNSLLLPIIDFLAIYLVSRSLHHITQYFLPIMKRSVSWFYVYYFIFIKLNFAANFFFSYLLFFQFQNSFPI